MTGKSKRILVVEDDDVLRLMTERQLEHLGYQASSSKDGSSGLTASVDFSPHLILMDVQMPIMDGLEATRSIRGAEAGLELPRVPIIAMTANPDREMCFEAGMDDFLFKPITLEQLSAMIVKWIGAA